MPVHTGRGAARNQLLALPADHGGLPVCAGLCGGVLDLSTDFVDGRLGHGSAILACLWGGGRQFYLRCLELDAASGAACVGRWFVAFALAPATVGLPENCLLYTSDAADDLLCV